MKTCSTCSTEMPHDTLRSVCGGCELREACRDARWETMQYATPKPTLDQLQEELGAAVANYEECAPSDREFWAAEAARLEAAIEALDA